MLRFLRGRLHPCLVMRMLSGETHPLIGFKSCLSNCRFCWPCSSSPCTHQPAYVIDLNRVSDSALAVYPVSETVLSWSWEGWKGKHTKVCGTSLHRIFFHIFFFQELPVYQWKVFHTSSNLLLNSQSWKKIFHLHLLCILLFCKHTLVS